MGFYRASDNEIYNTNIMFTLMIKIFGIANCFYNRYKSNIKMF